MNLAAEFVKCPARLLLDWVSFSVSLVQVFGKTMENVRKRVNVKIVRSDEEQKILKLVAKPTFARQVIFNPDLVGIQNRKEKVLLNKPIYVGMSVLDLSKHLMYNFDLICTTPRLCQNNMTPVAVRGRGTTSTYNCFPATGLYFKSKVLASVGRDSTETTRLQHGSSMFGDTHAKGGGGGLAASMATWLSSSLRNENGKLKIFVVRTTLLAKSHRC